MKSVRVEHGDWLCGDADGVVVIPQARADEIAGVAEEITAIEDQIRDAVATGCPLVKIRAQTGYHALQTRAPAGG